MQLFPRPSALTSFKEKQIAKLLVGGSREKTKHPKLSIYLINLHVVILTIVREDAGKSVIFMTKLCLF